MYISLWKIKNRIRLTLAQKLENEDLTLNVRLAKEEEARKVLTGRGLIRESVKIDTASVIQFEIEQLKQRWLNDPENVKFLEEQAKKRGKPFETVLEEDARWVVNERLRNGELF